MGRLLVEDLKVAPHAQGMAVRFTLPKGAFATTILREFMKGEGESLPPQEIDEQPE
jgi:tRNA(Glu) U13 pseudouridine synthase TruD